MQVLQCKVDERTEAINQFCYELLCCVSLMLNKSLPNLKVHVNNTEQGLLWSFRMLFNLNVECSVFLKQ